MRGTIVAIRMEVLGEREIEVGRISRISSSPKLPRLFLITYGNTVKNVFIFFYKITGRKIKRANSLLY